MGTEREQAVTDAQGRAGKKLGRAAPPAAEPAPGYGKPDDRGVLEKIADAVTGGEDQDRTDAGMGRKV